MPFPTYFTPQKDTVEIQPRVIAAFQRHFQSCTAVGGTEAEFVAEYRLFRNDFVSNYVQTEMDNRLRGDGADDVLTGNHFLEIADKQVDQLLFIILGMGQVAIAFKLLPTGQRFAPLEAPDMTPVASTSKTKPKEAQRFTHVLSSIMAKNFVGPGPHGIPEDAKGTVPLEEDMIAEMVEAMADESEILDFADTKPYKDHWRLMKRDPHFLELAQTLFYHLNQLHQGHDYNSGFRYTDRYRNLISLLRKCKGTIYFMSRPSTYEDVLLNPHMMQLRFADNQKNNAKKKIDNKELNERRNSEYMATHGGECPPVKERVYKGKKRSASQLDESIADAPAPAQRKKRNVKRIKTTAGTDSAADPLVSPIPDLASAPVSAPINTFVESVASIPLANGEGSSAQQQNMAMLIGSENPIGGFAQEYEQYASFHEDDYLNPQLEREESAEQEYHNAEQHPSPKERSKERISELQKFYKSQQLQQQQRTYFESQRQISPQQEPTAQQQAAAQIQQRPRPIAQPKTRQGKENVVSPDLAPIAPLAPATNPISNGVEYQIATTLSEAIYGANYAPCPPIPSDSSYFSPNLLPSYQQQQRQVAASYQNPSVVNTTQGYSQLNQSQNDKYSQDQYSQPGFTSQNPSWFSQQHNTQRIQQMQSEPQLTNQRPGNQQVYNQQPQNPGPNNQQQIYQFDVLTDADESIPAIDPCWSGEILDFGFDNFITNDKVPQSYGEAAGESTGNSLLQQLLTNNQDTARDLEDLFPSDSIFGDLDLDNNDLGNMGDHLNVENDINEPGFGDLGSMEDMEYRGIPLMENLNGYDLGLQNQQQPAIRNTSNTGGQVFSNKMNEMEHLLALDP